MKYSFLAACLLVLILAGCGGGTDRAQPTQTPVITEPTSVAAPTATAVITPEPASTAIPPQPTDTTAPPPAEMSLSDEAIISALKAAGIPIGKTVIFTAETDPNKLLGRPNQYIAKATWHDTRLSEPTGELGVEHGGGLEIYQDEAAAQARMDYIQELGKKMPILVEYNYVKGPVLLRVSKELTPTQAEAYKKALEGLSLP
jgi:hypothetical protein